jgi:shikimate dehydrogenase
MKRFALIGHPVAGSLSPRLFKAAYDGRYPYDLIDAPFEEAWAKFLAEYDGINVTAPYKQDAFRAVDLLSEGARACGAVNLVVKEGGLLHGYNTDVDGIVGAVRETGFEPSSTLIIGAGGAARAAVVAAEQLGCKDIVIANRTYEKAAALAAAHSCKAVRLEEIDSLRPDLVIYTIPGDARSVPGMTFPDAVVLEAEYKHPALSSAKCRRYISGLRWILWQAVAGYSLFTGEAPNLEALSRSIIY